MAKVTDLDFLDAYCGEADWAKQHGITARTVRRYRRAGLPHLRFAGRVYIDKRRAREWLEAHVKYTPPVRARRRA
jgi:hypothetical protein